MSILLIAQAIIGILLAFGILLQTRAGGLSAALGGAGTTYVQRRGAEKVLFQTTVVLAIVFFGMTVVQWYI